MPLASALTLYFICSDHSSSLYAFKNTRKTFLYLQSQLVTPVQDANDAINRSPTNSTEIPVIVFFVAGAICRLPTDCQRSLKI